MILAILKNSPACQVVLEKAALCAAFSVGGAEFDCQLASGYGRHVSSE
jgi:hypothetical protein